MVNVDPIVMDKDDSSSASLPSDPSRDESPPSKVEIREESDDEEESSSRHGSEKWMPQDDNSRKAMHAMMMYNNGFQPKKILSVLFPHVETNPFLSESAALKLIRDIVDKPPKRIKLINYNTFQDAVELFRKSKRILMLTGAGVSVSCGIPDFRSKDGIYSRLHVSFPDLPDPSAMFDIQYFRRNPKPFYDFAKEIFPGMFEPSFSHKLIAHLEKSDKLLRNYTQNIDTLEKVAGIERVIECHGSFSSASCINCNAVYTPDDIRENVMEKTVAYCRVPKCDGVIKPNIVFFGEDLHSDFHTQMAIDKHEADLVVVIGSSLKVRPVSLIPFAVSPDVPQILINREPIGHYTSDIELLGNCDDILREIAIQMGEEEFVKNYDENHGREWNANKKKMIPKDEFDEMIKKLDETQKDQMDDDEEEVKNENEVEENDKDEETNEKQNEHTNGVPELEKKDENGENEDGEPLTKRRKTEFSLSEIYTRKFVSIETLLPEDSFIQANTNQFVFRGAEVYIDMDSKVISERPKTLGYSMSDSSDDEDSNGHGCCEDDCSDEDCSRLPSSPYTEPPRSPLPLFDDDRLHRSSSCNPSLDTQSLVPSQVIRSTLNPYEDIEEPSSP
ncbi:sir-2.1 [Pristionchus pacificus]|uniref:NAD-dependent protein deacetylase sir-2.1 n=1 Tax=Pristionchus pacificus TaxID=54126 RepID=A0A2A6C2C6_PRIPA|nr:sir-2.1 [Pristionchus pacificus]|eukprot:PDM72324.1 sir-2.1 [Pristionchus pacificus]